VAPTSQRLIFAPSATDPLNGHRHAVRKKASQPDSYDIGELPHFPFGIAVMGADAGDVVSAIGGWLFDHITVGWRADVWLHDNRQARVLNILGARQLARPSPRDLSHSQILAVSATVLQSAPKLCETVMRLCSKPSAEIIVWGDCPDGLAAELNSVSFRPSSAASAFKNRAVLALAHKPSNAPSPELLLCNHACVAKRLRLWEDSALSPRVRSTSRLR
jgi:hypothetical protein